MRFAAWAVAMAVLLGFTCASNAAESCAPLKPGTKILRSKTLSDLHPDWRPPNQIGTSWSLIRVRHEGRFLSGQLVTPRGGELPGRVFVLADEWDCSA